MSTTCPAPTDKDLTAFARVPNALTERPQWVVWRYEDRGGDKPTKVPYDARSGRKASVDNPETWVGNAKVLDTYAAGPWDGIGYVFSADDPFAGIDFDRCIDANGNINAAVQSYLDRLNSYAEISPSLTGIKAWVRATIPGGKGRKNASYEMYDRRRFFTVTGRHVDGVPWTIGDRQDEYLAIRNELFPSPSPTSARRTPTPSGDADDACIIDKVIADPRWARLWSGDWSAYASQSEADLALLGRIGFFCGWNPSRMESLFGQSGLTRTKWDERPEYRKWSIDKSCAGKSQVYSWVRAGNEGPGRPGGGDSSAPDDNADTATDSPGESSDAPFGGDPIPLDAPPPTELQSGILPGWLGEHADAVSQAVETPLELAGLMDLAVLATVAQGTFCIRPEPGYFEELCLFLAPAMEPGNRKSAVVRAAVAPLAKWEQSQAAELEPLIKRMESERKTAEARVKKLREQAAGMKLEAQYQVAIKEIADIEAELADVPVVPRLFTEDCTVEHLGTMLSRNGERLGVLSDEGGFFDLLSGRYSDGVANLDLVLKAYSGSHVRVDRGSRPPAILHQPCLTIGLSPQPEVIQGLASRKGFRGRGFLDRFFFALPTSRLGYRQLEQMPVPPDVTRRYEEGILDLLGVECPRDANGIRTPFVLTLSGPGWHAWKEFQREVEQWMRPGSRLEHLKGWGGKLPGNVARLAGLFHLVEHGSAAAQHREVSNANVDRALMLARSLVEQALFVLGTMGSDPDLQAARRVWTVVEKLRRPVFTARDAWNPLRGTFKKVADVEPAFTVLLDHNWIAEPHQADYRERGRPSRVFHVHPKLTEEWP